jgi:hypothetical protein
VQNFYDILNAKSSQLMSDGPMIEVRRNCHCNASTARERHVHSVLHNEFVASYVCHIDGVQTSQACVITAANGIE